MIGEFATRGAAVADAKSSHWNQWFILIRYADDSWDYAVGGRPRSEDNRAATWEYRISRTSGAWYINWRKETQ